MRKAVLLAIAVSMLALGCGQAEDPKTTAPAAGGEAKQGSTKLPEDR